MTQQSPVLVWLRQDLRRHDNPALAAAAETGRPVLPVFILDDMAAGPWKLGGASRWWLHQALEALDFPVVLRVGDSASVISELLSESGATAVFWNRRLAPWAIAQDKQIKSTLQGREIEVQSFQALTLREPWEVKQSSGQPYKVYTPYSRAWMQKENPRRPVATPADVTFAKANSAKLGDLNLHPKHPDWSGGLADTFQISEASAEARLRAFIEDGLFAYRDGRNFPADDGTSMLAPYLASGVISPHRIFEAVAGAAYAKKGSLDPSFPFVRQLIWRDFAYSNLFHFNDMTDISLRSEFEGYPWVKDEGSLRAWQRGKTGFPIVDAGMRQLWQTGYMHNRVRMIAGSFLTKDLLIRWQEGARWFWDTLCDADLANNSMGWQWVAGCGIDAAPYFRIFNPTTQGEKFDPKGDYVRRFVPELANLPNAWIHKPHEAPESILAASGVKLGTNYPKPLVDHKAARQRALAGYQEIKKAA